MSENLLATASPEATPPQRRTLMRQLLAWGLGAMLIVWLSFVYVGWRTGVHEADELTDGHPRRSPPWCSTCASTSS